jgi:hypothetical protein
MLRALHVNPYKSAYKILNGRYNWNHYPLAPLGRKAVVYKEGNTRGSWASRGIDAFYLGPAKDHYRCNNYYIPDTCAYRVSGSTELFLQHCQLPSMTPHQHFCALTNELTEHTAQANSTSKGQRLLKLLGTRIKSLLHPPPISEEQMVIAEPQRKAHETEQRVIGDSPIITIPQITDAPPVMLLCIPTAKRTLQTTPRLHRHVTRNNTPGILLVPNVITPTSMLTATAPCPTRPIAPTRILPRRESRAAHTAIPGGAQQRIVTRHAINLLTLHKQASFSTIHTPRMLMKHANMRVNMEHYANPMVHPITSRTISSYKILMHNPATAEVWQTAFGKDFGGMAQGCNKTGQKGTNAIFVMTNDKIMHALAAKKFFHVCESGQRLSTTKR